MAKVVFADGSKDMAHNLDDLYERWVLRHEVEAKKHTQGRSSEERDVKIFVPPIPICASNEQASPIRKLIALKLRYLGTRLAEINQLGLPINECKRRKLHIAHAHRSLNKQQEYLKAHQYLDRSARDIEKFKNRKTLPLHVLKHEQNLSRLRELEQECIEQGLVVHPL